MIISLSIQRHQIVSLISLVDYNLELYKARLSLQIRLVLVISMKQAILAYSLPSSKTIILNQYPCKSYLFHFIAQSCFNFSPILFLKKLSCLSQQHLLQHMEAICEPYINDGNKNYAENMCGLSSLYRLPCCLRLCCYHFLILLQDSSCLVQCLVYKWFLSSQHTTARQSKMLFH